MALPDLIYAQASPLSIGGKSMFEQAEQIRPLTSRSVCEEHQPKLSNTRIFSM